VGPLKKKVHEEFQMFAVVDDSPEHHILGIVCFLE